MAIIYTLISVNTWPNSKTDTFFVYYTPIIVLIIYIQKCILLRTTSNTSWSLRPHVSFWKIPWEIQGISRESWFDDESRGTQGGVSVIYGALEDFPPEKTKIFSPENGVPLEVVWRFRTWNLTTIFRGKLAVRFREGKFWNWAWCSRVFQPSIWVVPLFTTLWIYIDLCSLKVTASFPWKLMVGRLEDVPFLSGRPIFRRELLVSGSVPNGSNKVSE